MSIEHTMLIHAYKRLTICFVLVGVVFLVPVQSASARDAGDDRLSQPSEYGVRFTPEMARALARIYTKEMIVRRYELDEAKIDEASEVIARHLMKLAHELDRAGYREPLEIMVTDIMDQRFKVGWRDGPRQGGTPEFGQVLAKGLLPALPAVREMIREVGQDIRPMLSMGQQLKFGKDLLLAETTFDTFEKSMERWARGEKRLGENPFQSDTQTIEKGEDGHSRAYNNAEHIAERSVERGEWTKWEKYVENAKAFYGFDEAQAAIADSILRECLERAEVATQESSWLEQGRRNRLWFHMLWHLGVRLAHPVRFHIERQYAQVSDPVIKIGEDLKRRIDDIPTRIQRQEADERIAEALKLHGYRERPFEPKEIRQPDEKNADEQSREASGSETGV